MQGAGAARPLHPNSEEVWRGLRPLQTSPSQSRTTSTESSKRCALENATPDMQRLGILGEGALTLKDTSLRDDLISLTSDLIAISSTADRPEQLQAVVDYVERYVRALGGVYLHRAESQAKPSLVVTLRQTRAPAVMLNAHLDVVPARTEQFQ